MDYKTIFSKRKTLCIQITRDGETVVRAPLRCSKKQIEEFVLEHKKWIQDKTELVKQRLENKTEYTPSQIEEMRKKAKDIIPPRVRYLSEKFSLYPAGIKITSAKTRYGSCSGKNALCFSLYLMEHDSSFIDHVILHELAHIKHKNHSKDFYAFLDGLEKQLKQNP